MSPFSGAYPTASTFAAAPSPAKISIRVAEGESVASARVNKVTIPSALTRQVMSDTESGVNVVNFANIRDLFDELDG